MDLSWGSGGAMFLIHFSAVGPQRPPVSRTKGIRRSPFWYRVLFCVSRSFAAVASERERLVVRVGQSLAASVTLMSMSYCLSLIVVKMSIMA